MGYGDARADREAGDRLAALAPKFLNSYGSLRELQPLLSRAPEKLRQPVRLAVVGQIKKGKSTLVNAMVGRRLAVTREEEATYRVNELRFGEAEGISAYYQDGPGGSPRSEEFPLDRLADLTVYDPDRTGELLAPTRIVVRVREERLRRLVLIDTPGLHSVHGADSAETQRLLTVRSAAAMDGADAILYLFDRDIGATDIDVVRDFLGPASSSRPANSAKALGVMSRCDRLWKASKPSLDPIAEGAERIKSRFEHEPELRRTFYHILPVAAIVAEGAQCLSAEDLSALRDLSSWDPTQLIQALRYPISSTFRSKLQGCPIDPDRCVALKEQLGAWGLLRAYYFMREKFDDATVIEKLVEVSGIAKLNEVVKSLYERQRYIIKLNALLDQVRRVIEEQQHAGIQSADMQQAVEEVRDVVEYINDNQAGLTEMQMARLIRQRQVQVDLGSADADRIARLAGIHQSIAGRLGEPEGTAKPELLAVAKAEVRHWRSPRYSGCGEETADVVRSAVRVAEDLAERVRAAIQLEAEAQDRLRRAAELMGK